MDCVAGPWIPLRVSCIYISNFKTFACGKLFSVTGFWCGLHPFNLPIIQATPHIPCRRHCVKAACSRSTNIVWGGNLSAKGKLLLILCDLATKIFEY